MTLLAFYKNFTIKQRWRKVYGTSRYVTFLNKFSRYVTNVINITVYPEKCLITPETVISPAGNSYNVCHLPDTVMIQETVIASAASSNDNACVEKRVT